jgi:hypothetical protein
VKFTKNDLITLMNPIVYPLRSRRTALHRWAAPFIAVSVFTWLPVTIVLVLLVSRSEPSGNALFYNILGVTLLSSAWVAAITYLGGRDRGLSEAQEIVQETIHDQIEVVVNNDH